MSWLMDLPVGPRAGRGGARPPAGYAPAPCRRRRPGSAIPRPDAAPDANDLHAASDPALGGGDEGRGRQVPEAPVGVLPFAAIRIASDRPAPGTEHGVERAVCCLYGAVHDGNGRALAGRKHRCHARLEWPLGISPAEQNRPAILAEKAGEPNPDRKTRGDSRFDDDLALIDVPDHLEHQQIGPGLREQLRL